MAVTMKTAALVALGAMLAAPSRMAGQTAPAAAPDVSPAPDFERPVSWKQLLPNIAQDQKRIWLFPLGLGHAKRWIPAVAVVGAVAGLVALDSKDAPYFRRTSSFDGFNRVFSGSNSSYGILAAPASMYIAGLATKNSKMQKTAMLAGEAIGDSEI